MQPESLQATAMYTLRAATSGTDRSKADFWLGALARDAAWPKLRMESALTASLTPLCGAVHGKLRIISGINCGECMKCSDLDSGAGTGAYLQARLQQRQKSAVI
jgi:hypothetical protein